MNSPIIMTLGFIIRDDKILLGMKKRGFGEGRWNGFGGKVEESESVHDAMMREFREECGLVPKNLISRGKLTFHIEESGDHLEGHLFSATKFDGSVCESDEMCPKWFLFKDIPFDTMWPDDRYWMPYFLEGKNIDATFYFKDTNTLIDFTINAN